MAAQGGEDAYVTLLLTDSYLPGALVLAHSLRDAGTTKKLACLVTADTVAVEVITELQTVYDYVIPVPTIRNSQPANLHLMNRPDLHSAFTKINLWKQTQFRKIVYVDADVVAYRAVDELFALEAAFSAAADIGWPDIFNTGVMVLTPNMGDYHALMAMAERGISFDGADQGLLNMHFKNNCNRLSFTYNVTPSAHYQYVPAYRHFQSSINMVHFIGADKPWRQGRSLPSDSGPFNEMFGRWWAVYDRHYHSKSNGSSDSKGPSKLVQYFVKGEYQPKTAYHVPVGEPGGHNQHNGQTQVYGAWDAQRQPPPPMSKPEALNFPHAHYSMSSDTSQFVPPARYPSPPKGYNAPQQRDLNLPPPIFPWEQNRPEPTRVFNDAIPPREHSAAPSVTQSTDEDQHDSFADSASVTVSSASELQMSEPDTPTIPTYPPPSVSSSDPWATFTLTNAWDDVPEIERYVGQLESKHRRVKSGGSTTGLRQASVGQTQEGKQEPEAALAGRRGSKVTDFPSESDRPSLPVTPAPVRRQQFWGSDAPEGALGQEGGGPWEVQTLPAAHGVPQQSDWDPVAQLQKLAKQQAELLQRLGGAAGLGGEYGAGNLGSFRSERQSEAQSPPGSTVGSTAGTKSPKYVTNPTTVLSPQPVKPVGGQGPVQNILGGGSGEGGAVPRSAYEPPSGFSSKVQEPSYQGPGATWEKGEDDVLDT